MQRRRCLHASRTGRCASATTGTSIWASTPSPDLRSNGCSISMHCWTPRGGQAPLPSSTWPVVIINCEYGLRIGKRRVSGHSWASSSGMWYRLVCRVLPDACHESGTYGRAGLSGGEAGLRFAARTASSPPPDPRRCAGGVGPAGSVPLSVWTIVWCIGQHWSSTYSTSRRYSISSAAGSCSLNAPNASSGGSSSASWGTVSRRKAFDGPAQGAVHRRVGDANVMVRGATFHRPCQLLPPLRGGLL
jgi:hypothetical protein